MSKHQKLFKSKRLFKGKHYRYAGFHWDKENAIAEKKKYKKLGWRVRIVTVERKRKDTIYRMYVRKTK